MNITKLSIPGAFVITPARRQDVRGYLEKTFDAALFAQYGMNVMVREQFHTLSHQDVVRGMHFQTHPHECAKYVSVSIGMIDDVVLDLRVNSPTYGQYLMVRISAENRRIVYVPHGCAHGFIAREEGTCTRYLQTASYDPAYDAGIRFDSFGAEWGITQPIVSPRDKALPSLATFTSPFSYGA